MDDAFSVPTKNRWAQDVSAHTSYGWQIPEIQLSGGNLSQDVHDG